VEPAPVISAAEAEAAMTAARPMPKQVVKNLLVRIRVRFPES
jgi:hypothetical protein